MDAIVAIDVANARITVQPGVTNLAVTRAVAGDGFSYAPDPSSQQVCTIGGNVAENSGGAHCLKHGFTTHHVLAATFVTADGRIARLGSAVADPPGLDLLAVVIGSEGTLGIVTEVTLRLTRAPERVETLLAAFSSTDAAGEAVSAIIEAGIVPAAIEMMDRLTIEAAEASVHAGYPDCEALLLVEIDGETLEVDATARLVAALVDDAGAIETRTAASDDERARMWRGRKAAFAAMGRVSPDYYVQDGVIPRTRLGEVLRGIRALEVEFGLRVGNVFHAGDGNLHPLVLYDGSIAGESDRALALAGRILDLCLAAGGSITGEHGVGHDKACAMARMFTGADLTVMDGLRAAFDPSGLANPGKVLPTPRLCGEVPGFYRAHPLERAGLAERM
jgi:glycolate oxidase